MDIRTSFFFLAGWLFLAFSLSAQSPDRETVTVEDFEKGESWIVAGEDCEAEGRLLPGTPFDLKGQEKVMGIKILPPYAAPFIITIAPPALLPLEKELLYISFHVQGMNQGHILSLLFYDKAGNPIPYKPRGEKLNFLGWKEVIVSVSPDLSSRARAFGGFQVKLNPLELDGRGVYLYLDQIQFIYRNIREME